MKNNTLRLIAVLMATLLLLCSLTACGEKVSEKPNEAVIDAMDTTKELAQKSNATKTFDTLSKYNYAEMNLDLSEFISSILSMAMGGMQVSLSSEIDLNMSSIANEDGTKAMTTLGLLMNGTALADIDMYTDGEGIVLASEALLGDKALGASIKDLVSWIAEMSGTDMSALGNYEEMLAKGNALAAKLEGADELLGKYDDIFFNAFFENAETTRTEETVTVDGETAEAVVFTALTDENKLLDTFKAVYTTYQSDAEAKDLVESLVEMFGGTAEDIANAYAEIDGFFADSVEEDPDTITARFVIDAKKGNLILVSLADEEFSMALTLGLNPEKPTYCAFEVDDNGEKGIFSYRVTEDTETTYAIELKGEFEGEKLDIPVTYNKTTNEYTVSLKVDGQTVELVGLYQQTADSLKITLDKVTVKADGVDASVTVGLSMLYKNSTEKVPEAPEYTDVTKMTDEEFNALGADILEKLEELKTLLPSDLMALLAMLG